MKRLRAAGLLMLLGALMFGAPTARAQEGTFSYSLWSLNGNTVVLRFLLPVADAQRAAGTNIEVLTQSRLGTYLLDHVAVRAGDQACTAIDQGYDIGKVDPLTVAAGLYGFEIFFRCPSVAAAIQSLEPQPLPGQASNLQSLGVRLDDHALFDRLPGQVNFARVQIEGGQLVEQLFTAHRQELALPRSGPPQAAGLSRYLSLGISQILGHLDHVCLLLGMVVLARQLRAARALLAGLAGGYAVSLVVAPLLPIEPRAGLLDAFVGFLSALVAAALIAPQLRRASLAALAVGGLLLWFAAVALIVHASWAALLLLSAALFATGLLALQAARSGASVPSLTLWLLPAVFGFLDGFVFPTALNPLQESTRALLPRLISFDLGAWVGGALLVLVPLLASAPWRGRRAAMPRALEFGTELSAAALAGLGTFWLLSRLHG